MTTKILGFNLLAMGWSPVTGHLPHGSRVAWLRHQLATQGFGIGATVENCGAPVPAAVAHKLDNDEPLLMAECAAKGIEVTITEYEIIFKK